MAPRYRSQKFSCHSQGCGKIFDRACDLSRHTNQVHAPLKKYVCTWNGCNYRSNRKSNFEVHFKSTHLKERPECPICGADMYDKASLSRHIRNKHQHAVTIARRSSAVSSSGSSRSSNSGSPMSIPTNIPPSPLSQLPFPVPPENHAPWPETSAPPLSHSPLTGFGVSLVDASYNCEPCFSFSGHAGLYDDSDHSALPAPGQFPIHPTTATSPSQVQRQTYLRLGSFGITEPVFDGAAYTYDDSVGFDCAAMDLIPSPLDFTPAPQTLAQALSLPRVDLPASTDRAQNEYLWHAHLQAEHHWPDIQPTSQSFDFPSVYPPTNSHDQLENNSFHFQQMSDYFQSRPPFDI